MTKLLTHGKLLLETCIGTKLGILNSRFLGDSLGNCTYFDVRGGCSVIDYIIVSEDIFHYISYFNVLPPVETSSHCIIRMAFNINTPIGNHDNEYLYIYLYSQTAKYNGEEKNNNIIIT